MNYHNTGLNGWRNWLRRNLGWISGVVAIINPAAGAVLKTIDIAMGEEEEGQRMAFDEPTPAEQAILDKWVRDTLTPFYTNTLKQITAVFGTKISPVEQLAIINEVIAKLCVVRAYYTNNETAGLSDNAIAARLDIIDKLFNIIDYMIDDSFTSNDVVLDNYSYTVENPSLFSPIRIPANASYSCQKYVNIAPASQQNNPIITVNPVITNPVTNQPVTVGSIKNNPVTGEPVATVIDPVTNQPVQVNPVTGQPITKDNNKTIAIVLVGLAVLVGLFYKQKKSIKI